MIWKPHGPIMPPVILNEPGSGLNANSFPGHGRHLILPAPIRWLSTRGILCPGDELFHTGVAAPSRGQTQNQRGQDIKQSLVVAIFSLLLGACVGGGSGGGGPSNVRPDDNPPPKDAEDPTAEDSESTEQPEPGDTDSGATESGDTGSGDTTTGDTGSGDAGGDSGEITREPYVAPITAPDNSVKLQSLDLDAVHAAGYTGQGVTVGVIDTGINPNHEQFGDRVLTAMSYNSLEDSAYVDDTDGHGTHVASLVAGATTGVAPEANLMIVKTVADGEDSAYHEEILRGLKYTAENGANVVNMSFDNLGIYTDDDPSNAAWEAVDANDVVAVISGGNNAVNITNDYYQDLALNDPDSGIETVFDHALVDDQVIAVGSIDDDGNLSRFSSFPGEDDRVNDNWLVAPGDALVGADNTSDTSYTTMSGTSMAAPIVAGVAALIRDHWPHLTAEDATFILLDTADRTFNSMYDVNTCGAHQDQNCGEFYFGQGQVDAEAAVLPVGDPVLATDEATVDQVQSSGGSDLSQTAMVVPSGLASNLGQIESALSKVALFDDYGRDFRADLSNRVIARDARDELHHVLSSATSRVGMPREVNAYSAGGVRSRAVIGQYGYDMVSLGSESAQLLYTDNPKRGLASLNTPLGLNLLTYTGPNSLLSAYDQARGLRLKRDLGQGMSLEISRWTAENSDLDGMSRAAMDSTQARLTFKPSDTVRLSLLSGMHEEENNVLGLQSAGALGLASSAATQTFGVSAEVDFAGGLSAFGHLARGHTKTDPAKGSLFRESASIESDSYGLGLAWQGETSRLGLVASQPMRVRSGSTQMAVPVGRTLVGEVVYEDVGLDLAPDHRQTNLELFMAREMNDEMRVSANLVVQDNPGHMAGREHAAMLGLNARF